MKIESSEYAPLERYRIEGDTVIIEMGLEEPFDVYDDKDPSPLRIRDLKKEVETYIIDSIREIPHAKKIRVVFYFDKFSDSEEEIEHLGRSYFDFFAFETKVKTHQIKLKVKRGLKSLLVGLSFLFFCIFMAKILKDQTESLFSSFFVEGLTVLGWVSLWTPIQVFLYEIWPLLETIKTFKRALVADVDFKSVKQLPEPRQYI